ncbi:hypothetical protein ACQJBY_048404 [Aegilops geniculata]
MTHLVSPATTSSSIGIYGRGGKGVDEELPKAITWRLVKDKVDLAGAGERGGWRCRGQGRHGRLSAFAKRPHIFIHCISATANDLCKEGKMQTINAEDVFKNQKRLMRLSSQSW